MEMFEKLKNFRKITRLSQSKFASYFGIPVRTIQGWERRGTNNPPPYIIEMMIRIWKLEHPEDESLLEHSFEKDEIM